MGSNEHGGAGGAGLVAGGHCVSPEQLPRKERLPGFLGNHTHRHPIRRLRGDRGVVDVQGVTPQQITTQTRRQARKPLRPERLIDLTPLDGVLACRAGIAHDELVVRRAAGACTGCGDERPVGSECALPALHGDLGQRSGW